MAGRYRALDGLQLALGCGIGAADDGAGADIDKLVKVARRKLREKFVAKYGWGSMSTRLRLQAHQGYETLKSFDRIDPHYLQLWLDFIYGNMYTRGILDDRTRLLMMVGICLAANEPVQLENHLRGSLMQGATPREVINKINADLNKALATPEVKSRDGFELIGSSPEAFQKRIQGDIALVGKIVKVANIQQTE